MWKKKKKKPLKRSYGRRCALCDWEAEHGLFFSRDRLWPVRWHCQTVLARHDFCFCFYIWTFSLELFLIDRNYFKFCKILSYACYCTPVYTFFMKSCLNDFTILNEIAFQSMWECDYGEIVTRSIWLSLFLKFYHVLGI